MDFFSKKLFQIDGLTFTVGVVVVIVVGYYLLFKRNIALPAESPVRTEGPLPGVLSSIAWGSGKIEVEYLCYIRQPVQFLRSPARAVSRSVSCIVF